MPISEREAIPPYLLPAEGRHQLVLETAGALRRIGDSKPRSQLTPVVPGKDFEITPSDTYLMYKLPYLAEGMTYFIHKIVQQPDQDAILLHCRILEKQAEHVRMEVLFLLLNQKPPFSPLRLVLDSRNTEKVAELHHHLRCTPPEKAPFTQIQISKRPIMDGEREVGPSLFFIAPYKDYSLKRYGFLYDPKHEGLYRYDFEQGQYNLVGRLEAPTRSALSPLSDIPQARRRTDTQDNAVTLRPGASNDFDFPSTS